MSRWKQNIRKNSTRAAAKQRRWKRTRCAREAQSFCDRNAHKLHDWGWECLPGCPHYGTPSANTGRTEGAS